MCFVLPLDTLQDADSLFLCGFFHRNRLESPLQCGILLNILAILRDRGRTDQLDLSASQGRFHDIGRINCPLGASGTDDRMQFIQKQDDISIIRDFFYYLFDPFLEFATILTASYHPRQIKRQQSLVLHRKRYISRHDPGCQSFHHGGLANTGFPDQAGIVLRPSAQDLDHSADFFISSDYRIQLSFPGQRRQIPAVLLQRRLFRLTVSLFSKVFFVQIAVLSDSDQGIHINFLYIGSQCVQQAYRYIFPLFDQGQQQMLRSGLLLSETCGLTVCFFQDPCGSGRISLSVLHCDTVLKRNQIPDHVHDLPGLHTVISQYLGRHTGVFL